MNKFMLTLVKWMQTSLKSASKTSYFQSNWTNLQDNIIEGRPSLMSKLPSTESKLVKENKLWLTIQFTTLFASLKKRHKILLQNVVSTIELTNVLKVKPILIRIPWREGPPWDRLIILQKITSAARWKNHSASGGLFSWKIPRRNGT